MARRAEKSRAAAALLKALRACPGRKQADRVCRALQAVFPIRKEARVTRTNAFRLVDILGVVVVFAVAVQGAVRGLTRCHSCWTGLDALVFAIVSAGAGAADVFVVAKIPMLADAASLFRVRPFVGAAAHLLLILACAPPVVAFCAQSCVGAVSHEPVLTHARFGSRCCPVSSCLVCRAWFAGSQAHLVCIRALLTLAAVVLARGIVETHIAGAVAGVDGVRVLRGHAMPTRLRAVSVTVEAAGAREASAGAVVQVVALQTHTLVVALL